MRLDEFGRKKNHLMNVLAITYSFAPLQFPATFRLLKWCKGLTELGHDITIVAVHPDTFRGPKDESLHELVAPHVRIVNVRSPENNLAYRAIRKKSTWFYKWLEPRKMEWFGAATRAVMDLELSAYDLVFSCSMPPVCHLIGREVARQTRLPWIAFFSDPWIPMRIQATKKIASYNARLEKEIVSGTDRVVVPSVEMGKQLVTRYGPTLSSKLRVLPHSYVLEWYQVREAPAHTNSGVIRVICTGSFYGPRTPLPLFEALRSLPRQLLPGKLRIEIYGGMQREYLKVLETEEFASAVEFRGKVNYLDSLAIMRNADYLLLVDVTAKPGETSVFLPSKLIDYLGAQRPILGLTPRKGAAARVLEATGNVVCDLYEPTSLSHVLEDIVHGSFKTNFRAEPSAVYEIENVARELVKIFQEAQNAKQHQDLPGFHP